MYYTEFCQDLKAVVDEVDSRFETSKIGVWSMSMGTIITARSFPAICNKIDFIIGEGFVTDTTIIVDRIKLQKDKDLILPEPPLSFSKAVAKIDIPLLILCGSNDIVTTTEDALELKKKTGSKCSVVEYDGEHLGGFIARIDEGFGTWYINEINSFLEKS